MRAERIGQSAPTVMPLTRQVLIQFRTRALRKRVWYWTLSRIERGLVDLTIRWVDNIRSKPMTIVVRKILEKLVQSMETGFTQVFNRGRILALKISELVTTWGNNSASLWKLEQEFQLALGLGVLQL